MIELEAGGWFIVAVAVLDLLMLCAVVVLRARRAIADRRGEWYRRFMRVVLPSAPTREIARALRKDPNQFLQEFMVMSDNAMVSNAQRVKTQDAILDAGLLPRLVRSLASRRPFLRKRAAIWLSYTATECAVRPLVLALEREKSVSVKVHIVYALARLGASGAIPTVIDSLADTDEAYRERVYGCLGSFGDDFTVYFPILRDRREPEIQHLVAEMAVLTQSEQGRRYLEKLVDVEDIDLRHHAARLLVSGYGGVTDLSKLLEHSDLFVRTLAVETLGLTGAPDALPTLLQWANDAEMRRSAAVAISSLVRRAPRVLDDLLLHVADPQDKSALPALLDVVEQHAEYLVQVVLQTGSRAARSVVVELVRTGRTSGVLAFLNRNTEPDAERTVVDLLAPVLKDNAAIRRQFAIYATDSVLRRLAIGRETVETAHGKRIGEATRPAVILGLVQSVVIAPVLLFVGIRWLAGHGQPALSWLWAYTNGFEIAFGVYAFALNIIYLALCVVASVSVSKQHAHLSIKPLAMMFSPGMLPSISVIVPAYCEETTIVENVSSLMNLRYPTYEVIVVNDGSSDDTMGKLIRSFQLERTDVAARENLETRPVRAIYCNPRIPELLVIDKENGGKADSLNAGINFSRHDYFAAIDSDSLLERDSLLHLSAHMLDTDQPVVATGGNILPINGCRVDQGSIDEIGLPRSALGRYQTLEYLRSFMAGRTGWAQIKSLMIISGAFGLFRRREVVDAHGYLTGSGALGKDTVAEDMELVVRIARRLSEAGKPYSIQYACNANCWTEVPDTFRILRNQRDRWQRGLIDTVVLHSRLLLNRRYGSLGMIGFPYFFVFELLGPWIEVQGFLFLLLGLATGTLSLPIAAFVFAATVPLGVAVSLSSLMLAEHHERHFKRIDRIRLVLLAIVENFGYRQYASLLRLRGYLSALRRRTGWGSMTRTGFDSPGRNTQ